MDRSWPLLTLRHDHAVRVIRVREPLFFLDLEVMVREVHVDVPVVGGDVVLARADAIADGALDQRGNRGLGPARDGQTVRTEQAIERAMRKLRGGKVRAGY